jgi:hypothetical protein
MEKETGRERAAKPKGPDAKAARLAAALKTNIARRKAQARARKTAKEPTEQKD